MHTVEIRNWIINKIPRALVSKFKGTVCHRSFNKTFDIFDDIRFEIYKIFRHKKDTPDIEALKLIYSWETYSKKYLKCINGDDFNHPSRIEAGKTINSIVEKYQKNYKKLKLLEIPFGRGTDYESNFSKMNIDYVGMELNPKQVELNKVKFPEVNFKVGNILNIKEEDQHFDIVYCRHIFEHLSLKSMETALKETYRVARIAIVYIFFSMEDIPFDKEVKTRKYNWNILSKEKMKKRIQRLDRVKKIQIFHTVTMDPKRKDTIFQIMLNPHSEKA